jgi:hypothetical protein
VIAFDNTDVNQRRMKMNNMLDMAVANIMSPPILFFIAGIVAFLLKSDLKIPESIGSALGIFLLLAIGLRSGVGIAKVGAGNVFLPALSAVFIGFLIAFLGYLILNKIFKIDPANSGCIAGHYGAVSAATLAVVLAYADRIGIYYEPFAPALYPFMDTTALITGIVLAKIGMARQTDSNMQNGLKLQWIIKDAVVGKGVFLLFGGLLIGYLTAEEGAKKIMPFYDTMFLGILTLFMLDIGLFAGAHLRELKKLGASIIIYTVVMIPIHGLMGIVISTLIGLSVGGTLILATLAASASYISAPAVMRAALPAANPSLALAGAVLIAFPLNAAIGIPIYHYLAKIFVEMI